MARLEASLRPALMLLFGLLQGVGSARVLVAVTDSLNATSNEEDAQGLGCVDYCVQCHDGSSVWYGRGRNWWKAGASLTVGSVAIAANAPGVGALGVALGVGLVPSSSTAAAVAAGAAGAFGVSQGVESAEETHTHWTGNIPSTGLSCERVDVVKFSKEGQCQAQYLMQKSPHSFGRVWKNMLKPYDENNQLRTEEGFTFKDNLVYKAGCKIVKGSGMTGGWGQFKSKFQSHCNSEVTKGANKCSMHSKLCGIAGVAGVTRARTADECLAQCQGGQLDVQCPAHMS